MPAGRPRKPTAQKRLAGTLRKCRTNPREPAPVAGLPSPPSWLSPRAATTFREHAAQLDRMGVLSLGDGMALALLALRLDEVERTSAAIEDLGAIQHATSAEGAVIARRRPEVAMRSSAMRHAQSLLAEFGLTPASHSRVSAAPPSSRNPFEDI